MTKKGKFLANGRSERKRPRFLTLPREMLISPQFCNLSPSSIKVLIGLCCRHTGFNNRRINFSQDDLKDMLHLGKATVSKALKELENKGFIVCTKKGYFTGRVASSYEITFITSEGYEPTNLWKNSQNPAPESRKNLTKIKEDFLSEMAMDIHKIQVLDPNTKTSDSSKLEPQ